MVLKLANAAPGALVRLAAVAVRRFKGDTKDTELPIKPSHSTLAVVLEQPAPAVIVSGTQAVAVKP